MRHAITIRQRSLCRTISVSSVFAGQQQLLCFCLHTECTQDWTCDQAAWSNGSKAVKKKKKKAQIVRVWSTHAWCTCSRICLFKMQILQTILWQFRTAAQIILDNNTVINFIPPLFQQFEPQKFIFHLGWKIVCQFSTCFYCITMFLVEVYHINTS